MIIEPANSEARSGATILPLYIHDINDLAQAQTFCAINLCLLQGAGGAVVWDDAASPQTLTENVYQTRILSFSSYMPYGCLSACLLECAITLTPRACQTHIAQLPR